MAAWIALVGFGLFMALAFGVRVLIHLKTTGSTGILRPQGTLWERLGGMLFALALVGAMSASPLQLAGWIRPVESLQTKAYVVLGCVAYALGLITTLWAQLAMGQSWRIGVDKRERTALVVTGPFRWVRNPIFSAVMICTLGLVLLTPNPVALTSLGALVLAVQLQVRLVEEPYLLLVHGQAYRLYAAHVGRFVPMVGTLKDPS